MTTFTTKKGLTLLVGAAVLGQLAALSSPANATAFAYSAMEVTNFQLNVTPFGGFSTFQFTSQPLSASLNGTTINSPSIQTATGSGGTTNQEQLTLGSAGFAADNEYFGANRREGIALPVFGFGFHHVHVAQHHDGLFRGITSRVTGNQDGGV